MQGQATSTARAGQALSKRDLTCDRCHCLAGNVDPTQHPILLINHVSDAPVICKRDAIWPAEARVGTNAIHVPVGV